MNINSISEALKLVSDFDADPNPGKDKEFLFTEALEYLIHETGDPEYMFQLGGFYYDQKRFDLALKYYEAAAEKGNLNAINGLGYIWYYGRTGTVDYEKAFRYYSQAAEMGNLNSAVKVADMYKNGYFVEKDYEKYKSMIRSLYPQVKDAKYLNEPLPEVFTRLSRICREEGDTSTAVELLQDARPFLEQRMMNSPFFGTLNQLKWLINDLYSMVDFDSDYFGLYDLFWLLKEPKKVRFLYEDKYHNIEAAAAESEPEICFDGKWYRTCADFLAKAEIDGERLTAVYDELYGFEVI